MLYAFIRNSNSSDLLLICLKNSYICVVNVSTRSSAHTLYLRPTPCKYRSSVMRNAGDVLIMSTTSLIISYKTTTNTKHQNLCLYANLHQTFHLCSSDRPERKAFFLPVSHYWASKKGVI